jgi:hypothetical protein
VFETTPSFARAQAGYGTPITARIAFFMLLYLFNLSAAPFMVAENIISFYAPSDKPMPFM